MAQVECDIQETTLENEEGIEVDGITATCSRCGNETESFGTSGASVRRCLVLMRENCPKGEANFYVASSGEDE
jgi:hypothetical protein